jgi:hypothetical protein
MIWDVGAPPQVSVAVYGSAGTPTLALDECNASAPYWDNGIHVGSLVFSADGNGTLSGRSVWFQTNPSELVIDPGALATNTFRFALFDEDQHYRAEFKAANVELVLD